MPEYNTKEVYSVIRTVMVFCEHKVLSDKTFDEAIHYSIGIIEGRGAWDSPESIAEARRRLGLSVPIYNELSVCKLVNKVNAMCKDNEPTSEMLLECIKRDSSPYPNVGEACRRLNLKKPDGLKSYTTITKVRHND